MRAVFILLLYICALNLTQAQDYQKFDVGLIEFNSLHHRGKADTILQVFIFGDTEQVRKEVEALGRNVNTSSTSILTTALSPDEINSLSYSKNVQHIQLGRPVNAKLDEVLRSTQVDKVHRGEYSLSQSYTGNNVIIGIIDSGIDYLHKDFINEEGNSKILSIWDQSSNENDHPKGFSYGSEWKKKDINAAIHDHTRAFKHYDTYGHGTHIAGLAAGNHGVAPDANIIVVKIDFKQDVSIVDATNYIFQKAEEMGMPCVINASIGSHLNSHDGNDPQSKMIDDLLLNRKRRAFVASAGNEGDDYMHVYYDINSDTPLLTQYLPKTENEIDQILIYGIIENKFLPEVKLKMSFDNCVRNIEGELEVVNHGKLSTPIPLNSIGKLNHQTIALFFEDNDKAGDVDLYFSKVDEKYSEMLIKSSQQASLTTSGKKSDLLNIVFDGKGKVHLWTLNGKTRKLPLYDDFSFSYCKPDNEYTVTAPGSAKEVICVGAYVNRTKWMNINGIDEYSIANMYDKGQLADFSSQGPTIDGRTKPDITAPGMGIISSLSQFASNQDLAYFIAGREGEHAIKSGTSMASPIVAGILALLFERFPNANFEQLRSLILHHTEKDSFTGELHSPNNQWGYGKVNALKIFEAKDNYYEALKQSKNELIQAIYPCPADRYVNILFNRKGSGHLQVINHCGHTIYQKTIYSNKDQYRFNISQLNAGLYFIQGILGDTHFCQKLIIQ